MSDNEGYYFFGIICSVILLITLFSFAMGKVIPIIFAISLFILIKILSLVIIGYFIKQIIKTIDQDHSYEINRMTENLLGTLIFSITHLITYFIYILVCFIEANINASKDYLSIKIKEMILKVPEQEEIKETYRD